MSCSLTLILLVAQGCRGQANIEAHERSAPQDGQGSTVSPTLRIEDHFNGPDLELARAAGAGDAAGVTRSIRETHANPNAISSGGLPVIAWPILQGSADGVQAMLENGANPNLSVPSAGTAMAWVTKAADSRMLQAFLDHGGDVNAQNNDGEPLTRLASLAGHWDNVKLLIERGADVNAQAHGKPEGTLLGYYSAGQFDKALWLLEHGADPGYRIEQAAAPERVGAYPIVENIYWWPVQAGRFPELALSQQRCQDLLAKRGFSAPKEPTHLQRLRASQDSDDGAGDTTGRDLDNEIAKREAELKQKLDGTEQGRH